MKTQLVVLIMLATMGCVWADDPNTEAAKHKSILQRIKNRDFPSIFQAWNECDAFPDQSPEASVARHDLVFVTPEAMGLTWNNSHSCLADGFTAESLAVSSGKHDVLLAANPNLIILAEIRCCTIEPNDLPADHAWLVRDPNGNPSTTKTLKLDMANPDLREQLAKQAKSAVDTGVFDGVMLNFRKSDQVCLELIKAVRNAIGTTPLILCRSADHAATDIAPYINGLYMEYSNPEQPQDWQRMFDTLKWAEDNLRKPTINCLEIVYRTSREDLRLMRAAAALTMAVSDGYYLFSDPDILPTPDHQHSWYSFWDVQLGKPTDNGKKDENGCYTKSYEHGLVVYNPQGNVPAAFTFPNPVKSAATENVAVKHAVDAGAGDIFLNLSDAQPAVPPTN